jgi:hypothetical protein
LLLTVAAWHMLRDFQRKMFQTADKVIKNFYVFATFSARNCAKPCCYGFGGFRSDRIVRPTCFVF